MPAYIAASFEKPVALSSNPSVVYEQEYASILQTNSAMPKPMFAVELGNNPREGKIAVSKMDFDRAASVL